MLIDYRDKDNFDGISLERTFSDSLFDVWKLEFKEGSSELLDEMSEITFNTFIQSLSREQFIADVMWQVEAVFISQIVGAFTTQAGAALTYAALNIMKGFVDKAEQDNIIRAKRLLDKDYKKTKTLSKQWIVDDWFGDMMSTALIGSPFGIYAPVQIMTDEFDYKGEIVLAPADVSSGKTEFDPFGDLLQSTISTTSAAFGGVSLGSGTVYNNIVLDYSLQTRNYPSWSSVNDSRVFPLLFLGEVGTEHTYWQNSITHLEDVIFQNTKTYDDDEELDKVVPYMYSYYPLLTFGNSENVPTPDFYEGSPLIVSDKKFDSLKDVYHKVYKVWQANSKHIQIVPSTSKLDFNSEIEFINVYLASYDDENDKFSIKKNLPILNSADFSFNSGTGVITIDENIIDLLNLEIDLLKGARDEVFIVLEANIEKYQSIEDNEVSDSEQELSKMAVMQSVQASVLEYYYQSYLATQAQNQLNEIAYTVLITLASTFLTGGISGSLLKEPLEEVFIDPFVESVATGFTELWTDDEYVAIVASTLAETGRESAGGSISTKQSRINKQNDLTHQKKEAAQKAKDDLAKGKDGNPKWKKILRVALPAIAIFAAAATGIGAIALFGTMATASVLGPGQKTKAALIKILESDMAEKRDEIYNDDNLNPIEKSILGLENLNFNYNTEPVASRKRRVLSRGLKVAAFGAAMFGAAVMGGFTVLNPTGKMLHMTSGQIPIPRADMFAKTIRLSEVTPPKAVSVNLESSGVEVRLTRLANDAATYVQTFGSKVGTTSQSSIHTMLAISSMSIPAGGILLTKSHSFKSFNQEKMKKVSKEDLLKYKMRRVRNILKASKYIKTGENIKLKIKGIKKNLREINSLSAPKSQRIIPVQFFIKATEAISRGDWSVLEDNILGNELLSRLVYLDFITLQFEDGSKMEKNSYELLDYLDFAVDESLKISQLERKAEIADYNTKFAKFASEKVLEKLKDILGETEVENLASLILKNGFDDLKKKAQGELIITKMIDSLWNSKYRNKEEILVRDNVKNLIKDRPIFFTKIIMVALANKLGLTPEKGKSISSIDITKLENTIEGWFGSPNSPKQDLETIMKENHDLKEFLIEISSQLEIYFHFPLRTPPKTLEYSSESAVKGATFQLETFRKYFNWFRTSEYNDPTKYQFIDIVSGYDSSIPELKSKYGLVDTITTHNELDGPGVILKILNGKNDYIAVYKEDKNYKVSSQGVGKKTVSNQKYSDTITTTLALKLGKNVHEIKIVNLAVVGLNPEKSAISQNQKTRTEKFAKTLGYKTTGDSGQHIYRSRAALKVFASKFNEANRDRGLRVGSNFEEIIELMEENDIFLEIYFEAYEISDSKRIQIRNAWSTKGKNALDIYGRYYYNTVVKRFTSLISDDLKFFPEFTFEKLTKSNIPSDDIELYFEGDSITRYFMYQNDQFTVKDGKRMGIKIPSFKTSPIIDVSSIKIVEQSQLSQQEKDLFDGKIVSVVSNKENGENKFWVHETSERTVPDGYELGYRVGGDPNGKLVQDMIAYGSYATQNLFKVEFANGEGQYVKNTQGTLQLRDELDLTSELALETQLHKLLSRISKRDGINNMKDYIEYAMTDEHSLEDLDEGQNLYILTKYADKNGNLKSLLKVDGTLLFDYTEIFKLPAGELKELRDEGYPALLKRESSGPILGYQHVTKQDFDAIFSLIPDEYKINTVGGAQLIMAPDGQFFGVNKRTNKICIYKGITYVKFSTDNLANEVYSAASLNRDVDMAFEWMVLSGTEQYAVSGVKTSKIVNSIVKSASDRGIYMDKNDLQNYFDENGLDVQILSVEIENSLNRQLEVRKLWFLGDLIIREDAKVPKEATVFSITPEEFKLVSNNLDIKVASANIKLINTYLLNHPLNLAPTLYLKMLSREDKIIHLAKGLGIVNKFDNINFNDKKKLKEIVGQINEKIGPFLLNMILIDKLTLDEDGRWRCEAITEGLEYFKAQVANSKTKLANFPYHKVLARLFTSKSIYLDNLDIFVPIKNDFSQYLKELEVYLNSYVQKKYYANEFSTLMNSEHISEFEKALSEELVFKKLEDLVNSEPSIPKKDKKNVLLAFKLQFLEFNVKGFSTTENNKLQLFEEFREIVFEIQTGTIKDDIELTKSFEFAFDNYPKISIKLTLTAADLNLFFSKYGLPNSHRQENFYYVKDDSSSKIPKSYRDLLALENFAKFKYNFYDQMMEIESNLIINRLVRPPIEGRPFRHTDQYGNPDKKLFIRFYSKKIDANTLQIRESDARSKYGWFRKDDANGPEPFVLDFTESADSERNELNILRIYTALLVGYSFRISTSETIFDMASRSKVSTSIVAHVTRLGCKIVNRYDDIDNRDLNGIEKKINSILDQFFEDTNTIRTASQNDYNLHLPYAHPKAIFDNLFLTRLSSGAETQKSKYKIINKYVDFVKLGEIMNKKNPTSAQGIAWANFIALVGNDLSRVRIDSDRELGEFLKAVLITPPPNLPATFRTGFYIDPTTYEVDPEFHTALRLDEYLETGT